MSDDSLLDWMFGSAPIKILPADLLLPIFLNVPIRDILVSVQRVCKQWHAFISDCKPIQEALHFRPITAKPLKENAPPDPRLPRPKKTIPHGKICTSLIAHPVLGRHLWNNTFNLNNKAALSAPEASWRRALATQPAVKELMVCESRVYAKDMAVGVTVQDVVDAMNWEQRNWDLYFVSVRHESTMMDRPRWQYDVVWEFQERMEGMVDVKAENESIEDAAADDEQND